jgi:hypothetical protein
MRIPTWTHLEGAETVINDSTWQIPASGVKHKHTALLFFSLKMRNKGKTIQLNPNCPILSIFYIQSNFLSITRRL